MFVDQCKCVNSTAHELAFNDSFDNGVVYRVASHLLFKPITLGAWASQTLGWSDVTVPQVCISVLTLLARGVFLVKPVTLKFCVGTNSHKMT